MSVHQVDSGIGILSLPHGVEANGIALGVTGDGDETVLANGKFLFENRAAIQCDSLRFNRAVLATEVNQRPTTASCAAFHFAERPVAAVLLRTTRKHPHFQPGVICRGIAQRLQFPGKNSFVKGFSAGHVIDIDFEPTDGIACVIHKGGELDVNPG